MVRMTAVPDGTLGNAMHCAEGFLWLIFFWFHSSPLTWGLLLSPPQRRWLKLAEGTQLGVDPGSVVLGCYANYYTNRLLNTPGVGARRAAIEGYANGNCSQDLVWKGPSPPAPSPTSLQLHTPLREQLTSSCVAAMSGPTREMIEVPSLKPSCLEVQIVQPLWPGEGNADVNTAKHWQPREPKGRPYER